MANPVQNSLKQSNLSLNKIQSSVNSFSKSMSSARSTTTTLNKSLTESSRQKRKALQVDHIRFFRRRDAVRKRENENVIEASSVGGAIKRTGKVIADSTKGFLGRILDFFGVVLLGWLINHLPIIIKHATIAIQKLQRVIKILKGFISSIGNIFWGLGNILKGGLQNLLDLDITDQSGRVQQGFDQLNEGFGGLGIMLDDIGNVFSTWSPNEEGIDPTVNQLPDEEPEDEKPQGFMRGLAGAADFATFGLTDFDKRGDLFKGDDQQTQSSQPGAVGDYGQATKALLDSIAFAEGTYGQDNSGYNTHFGFDQTDDLSAHPNIVKHGEKHSSAAFGRYQFMPGTWQGVGGATNAGGSMRGQSGMDMSPANQDKGAVMLTIRRLKAAGYDVNNASDLENLLQKEGLSRGITDALSPEWASLPKASGGSYYSDQSAKEYGNVESFYERRLNAPRSKPQSKPEGFMRGLAGFADFATFGLTDLDGDLFESKPKGDQISANLVPSSEGEVVFIPMHSSPQSQPQPQPQPSSSGASQSSTIALNRSAGANELYKQIVLANLQYT